MAPRSASPFFSIIIAAVHVYTLVVAARTRQQRATRHIRHRSRKSHVEASHCFGSASVAPIKTENVR